MAFPFTFSNQTNPDIKRVAFLTLSVVFIFFFIDEGYYDLRWMASIGNWIVFIIYLLILFPLQWGLTWALMRIDVLTHSPKATFIVAILVNMVLLGFLFI